MLKSDRLLLRPLKMEDVRFLIEWLSNWEIAKWLEGTPYPFTEEDGTKWVSASQKDHTENELPKGFAIEHIEARSFVGTISFSELEDFNGIKGRELGYFLGGGMHGKGYMSEALSLLLGYFFESFSDEAIYACSEPENKKSGRVLDRAGFKLINNDEIKDFSRHCNEEVYMEFYGLLRSDYKRAKAG